jgi:hypothetical protein
MLQLTPFLPAPLTFFASVTLCCSTRLCNVATNVLAISWVIQAISIGRQWFRPHALVHFELSDYHRMLRQHGLMHALTLLMLMRRYIVSKVDEHRGWC